MPEWEQPCWPLTLMAPSCSQTDMQIEICKRISAAVPVTSDQHWPSRKNHFSSSTATEDVVVVVVAVVVAAAAVTVVGYQCRIGPAPGDTGCIPGKDREQINDRHRPQPSPRTIKATPCHVSAPPPFSPPKCLHWLRSNDSIQISTKQPFRSVVFPRREKSNRGTRSPLRPRSESGPPRCPNGGHRRDWMKERTCIAGVGLDNHGEADHNRLCSCVLLSVI